MVTFNRANLVADADLGIEEPSDEIMETDEPQAEPATSPSFLSTLVLPLISLIQPTALSFPPLSGPSPHPPTTSALSAVHISALECLNNVFLSLTISPPPSVSQDIQSGLSVWNAVWAALELVGTQTTASGQERRQEFWDIAVGVLWGIGNVWKGAIEPKAEQVQVLIQLCDSTTDERLRVKCIGTLECLAQFPTAVEQNKVRELGLLSGKYH